MSYAFLCVDISLYNRRFFGDADFSGKGFRRRGMFCEIEDDAPLAGGEGDGFRFCERRLHEGEDFLGAGKFVFGAGAFHGDEGAADGHEGERPFADDGEAFHGAGDDDVEGLAEFPAASSVFGTHVDAFRVFCSGCDERFFDAGEFLLDGVHEDGLHIGAENREKRSRKSGPGAKIQETSALGDIFFLVGRERIIYIFGEALIRVFDAGEIDVMIQFENRVVIDRQALCRFLIGKAERGQNVKCRHGVSLSHENRSGDFLFLCFFVRRKIAISH